MSRMKLNYCYICGSKLEPEKEGAWWCNGCQQQYYTNPKPCVELALFDEAGRILLAERAREPNKGKYDLPGGFIDNNETAEAAILRETEEELGLNADQFSEPRYALSYTGDYPYGRVVYENLILVFAAKLKPGANVLAQDDVASVKFVSPKEIDTSELATLKLVDVINKAQKALI